MTEHFNSDQLNSYLHQSLTDAEREALDRHLVDCAACRVRLNGHETLQQRIHNELFINLRQVQPSARMSYAAITPRLKRPGRLVRVMQQSNQLLSGTATLAVLIALGIGLVALLNSINWPIVENPEVVMQPTTRPTVVVGPPETNPVEFVWQISGDPYPLNGPNDVAVDAEGNLYVIDGYNHRVQKFDRNGQFLAMWGSKGVGNGQFKFASGGGSGGSITIDEQGFVYVLDTDNTRIQKFDGNGQFLNKWGSRGTGNGQFSVPMGVAVDSQGQVYVADCSRHDIQKFDRNGQFLTRWGSRGKDDGQFGYCIQGVAVDEQGNIYVTDGSNHRIQKFNSNGQFLARWGAGGLGNGQFNFPADVAVDTQGNIYVADDTSNRIQKFDSNGQFLIRWGSFGADDGQFNYPTGVAVDKEGNVYVADTGNDRIQKFRQP